MNRNSHRFDSLISTVSVNDRGLATLSHRLIGVRGTLRTVRSVKPKAMCGASMRPLATAAAQPRFESGYARPQGTRPVAEQAACPRWPSLWAAVVMSRLSRV